MGWQFDGLTIWWVNNLTGQQFDGSTIWWVNNLMGQQFDRSTIWWVDNLTGRQCDGSTICWVDNLTGWHLGIRHLDVRHVGIRHHHVEPIFFLDEFFPQQPVSARVPPRKPEVDVIIKLYNDFSQFSSGIFFFIKRNVIIEIWQKQQYFK
jgi:hypothetical protein